MAIDPHDERVEWELLKGTEPEAEPLEAALERAYEEGKAARNKQLTSIPH